MGRMGIRCFVGFGEDPTRTAHPPPLLEAVFLWGIPEGPIDERRWDRKDFSDWSLWSCAGSAHRCSSIPYGPRSALAGAFGDRMRRPDSGPSRRDVRAVVDVSTILLVCGGIVDRTDTAHLAR